MVALPCVGDNCNWQLPVGDKLRDRLAMMMARNIDLGVYKLGVVINRQPLGGTNSTSAIPARAGNSTSIRYVFSRVQRHGVCWFAASNRLVFSMLQLDPKIAC